MQRMSSPLVYDSLVFRDRYVKMKTALGGVLENRVDVGTNDVLYKSAGRTVDREGDVVTQADE
jgi:hypothetical protein